MAKPQLGQVVTLDSVLHLNDWTVEFLRLPPALAGQLALQNVNIRAFSMDVPRLNINPIQIDIRGHRFYVPGDKEFDSTFTLQLHETSDTPVAQAFYTWFTLIQETYTGFRSDPSLTQLKADLKLTLLDRNLNPRWEYRLYGAWPQTIDYGGQVVGDKGADIIRPTITFNFDWFDAMQV